MKKCNLCGKVEDLIQTTCCNKLVCDRKLKDFEKIMDMLEKYTHKENWRNKDISNILVKDSCLREHEIYHKCTHKLFRCYWLKYEDVYPETFKCDQCNENINLNYGQFSYLENKYFCSNCTTIETLDQLIRKIETLCYMEKATSSNLVQSIFLDDYRFNLLKKNITFKKINKTKGTFLGHLIYRNSQDILKNTKNINNYLGIKYTYKEMAHLLWNYKI